MKKKVARSSYGGFPIVIDNRDIMVTAPDGDVAFKTTMAAVRRWVRIKRKELR